VFFGDENTTLHSVKSGKENEIGGLAEKPYCIMFC
jgi:hypothetical protein